MLPPQWERGLVPSSRRKINASNLSSQHSTSHNYFIHHNDHLLLINGRSLSIASNANTNHDQFIQWSDHDHLCEGNPRGDDYYRTIPYCSLAKVRVVWFKYLSKLVLVYTVDLRHISPCIICCSHTHTHHCLSLRTYSDDWQDPVRQKQGLRGELRSHILCIYINKTMIVLIYIHLTFVFRYTFTPKSISIDPIIQLLPFLLYSRR